jgi:hypothetical protein
MSCREERSLRFAFLILCSFAQIWWSAAVAGTDRQKFQYHPLNAQTLLRWHPYLGGYYKIFRSDSLTQPFVEDEEVWSMGSKGLRRREKGILLLEAAHGYQRG